MLSGFYFVRRILMMAGVRAVPKLLSLSLIVSLLVLFFLVVWRRWVMIESLTYKFQLVILLLTQFIYSTSSTIHRLRLSILICCSSFTKNDLQRQPRACVCLLLKDVSNHLLVHFAAGKCYLSNLRYLRTAYIIYMHEWGTTSRKRIIN
jgi:hypothetical protein